MSEHEIGLIDELLEMTEHIGLEDTASFARFQRRGEMILKKIFGGDGRYASELACMHFGAMWMNPSQEEEFEERQKVLVEACNLLQTAREDLSISGGKPVSDSVSSDTTDIFVVHGHDEEMKQSVARVLEKLGLQPIILHEQPNRGRTIIEKFSDHSQVGFAVVLLSPDDIGRDHNEKSESFRARQNVILELGFFLGKLGRDRVATVYREHVNFDMPSDYAGVLFIPYDSNSIWRFELAKELRECGYDIDFNAIA